MSILKAHFGHYLDKRPSFGHHFGTFWTHFGHVCDQNVAVPTSFRSTSARFRECCRQVLAEVMSKSMKKINKTWPKPCSQVLPSLTYTAPITYKGKFRECLRLLDPMGKTIGGGEKRRYRFLRKSPFKVVRDFPFGLMGCALAA